MPELRAIQERLGCLPDEDVKELAARLDVHLHQLHEVISFFPHFRRELPPDVEVHVCRDMACHLGGQASCLSKLEGVAVEFGGASRVKVEGTSCLGRCDGAPAVLIELHRTGTPDSVRVLTRPTCRDYVASYERSSRRTSMGGTCHSTLSTAPRTNGGSTLIRTSCHRERRGGPRRTGRTARQGGSPMPRSRVSRRDSSGPTTPRRGKLSVKGSSKR